MVVDLVASTSPQSKLIGEMIELFLQNDLHALGNHLHKDFCHVFHPQSLCKSPISKEEWLANAAKSLSSPMKFNQHTIHSLMETPGKAIAHISSNITTLSGQDEVDESVWILTFTPDEDGSLKMKDIEQFTSNDYVDIFEAAKVGQ